VFFFLNILLKNGITLVYGCKIVDFVVLKLCAIFLEHPVYHYVFIVALHLAAIFNFVILDAQLYLP